MDVNVLREAATVVSFLTFMGILLWAVHPAQRVRFEEAANAPFDEGDEATLSTDATLSPDAPATLSPTLSQGRGSDRGTGFRVRER